MASNIPGRRISSGETFFTDWGPRGGDCVLLRAQVLHRGSDTNGEIHVSIETRSAESTTGAQMNTAFPSTTPRLLVLDSVGVKTAIYTATTADNSPPRGCKEQVRFKIEFVGEEAAGEYYVIRLLPLVFFDNATA